MSVCDMIPHSVLFFFFLLCSIPSAHSSPSLSSTSSDLDIRKREFRIRADPPPRNVPADGYYNPQDGGGSMLLHVDNTYPPGQSEPMNIIISGQSDADVLKDRKEKGGLLNYYLSFQFSGECLGQHMGLHQGANLGDGNDYKNETNVMRFNYGDPQLGACQETFKGGNHFRYWIQDGSLKNSGAVFMGASYELPLELGHDIVPNGYNLGRDWLIGNITHSPIPTRNLTDGATYTGISSWGGYVYRSNIKYVTGLLPNTSIGINHNLTVGVDGVNSVDGLVAVLTITITERPPGRSSAMHFSPTFWELGIVLILTLLIST